MIKKFNFKLIYFIFFNYLIKKMADNLTPNKNLETPIPQLLQKNTYKTPYNCTNLVFFIVGIIIGGGLMILMIYIYITEKKNSVIIFIIVIFIWTLIFNCSCGGCENLYIIFSIDTYLGIIKIERVKIYRSFYEIIEIQIKNVQKVIIQKNKYERYVSNGKTIDAIEVIFKLNNESEIKACSKLLNFNNESNKIYNFIRSSLRENISVENLLSLEI